MDPGAKYSQNLSFCASTIRYTEKLVSIVGWDVFVSYQQCNPYYLLKGHKSEG